jgi:hypothetical protein
MPPTLQPAFRVSAIPMTRALPNVLDLPLISKFVKEAITAGTAEFTAPKSMTLNMEDILGEAAIGGAPPCLAGALLAAVANLPAGCRQTHARQASLSSRSTTPRTSRARTSRAPRTLTSCACPPARSTLEDCD